MPPVLEIEDLSTHIQLSHSVVKAVGNVSLHIERGETLGLVGESGCGKSMTGLSIMRLLPNGGHIIGGSIRLDGTDLVRLGERQMRNMRGNEVSMVFQDSLTSLNPTKTVGDQIAEQIRRHQGGDKVQAREKAAEALGTVGFPRPRERLDTYPHQLSGGQRQRVMIAMALSCQPKLLIADEPTTALDVTIQAQILGLLDDLKERLGMAVLLVTHDMGVVAGRADRVNVMYAGRIVETGTTSEIFKHMHHPYTQGLLGSIPLLTQDRNERLFSIPGIPPDLTVPPPGCRFAPRCRRVTDKCRVEEPPLMPATDGHYFSCWHPVDGPVTRTAGLGAHHPASANELGHTSGAGTPAPLGTAPLGTAPLGAAPPGAVDPGPVPLGTEAVPFGTGAPWTDAAPFGTGAPVPDVAAAGDPSSAGSWAVASSASSAASTAGPRAGAAMPVGSTSAVVGRPRQTGSPVQDDGRLLVIDEVVREYAITAGVLQRKVASVKAVSGISLAVGRGQTFGLVGESGCGKTTLGKVVVGLEKPDHGSVTLGGTDVFRMRDRELRRFRRDLQMVFQDPIASLDPRMRVGAILREPMSVQGIGSKREQDNIIGELLSEVGLPANAVERFPHEFSGGQRQRIGLARALTLNPRVIVADEPVSALDVSIRSQVLNLMKRVQATHGLTYLVISHDLAVVKYMSDRIGVMYLGKLVEVGSGDDIYLRPAHHYTAGLVATVPEPDPDREKSKSGAGIAGELPSPVDPPSGCRFRTRCPAAQELCAKVEPPLRLFHPGHLAACHFPLQQPAEPEENVAGEMAQAATAAGSLPA